MPSLKGFRSNRRGPKSGQRKLADLDALVKTAFLTLLYNDIIYIMDSEHEIDRSHADLTMIIRPDKRYGKVFDVLIEFKFVTLKEAGLDGEKARKLSETELRELPQMQNALETGRDQTFSYGDRLEKKHGNLRLKRFMVVSLGFERICFEAVGNYEKTEGHK